MSNEEFSFPDLSSSVSKVPLTAGSTVHDVTTGVVQPVTEKQENGHSELGRKKCQRNKRLGIGNYGFNRSIKKEEVALHNTLDDGWIIIHQKVYNLTPYLHYHPGGIDILKPVLGKDGTFLFEKYHRWVNVDALLAACWLGIVQS